MNNNRWDLLWDRLQCYVSYSDECQLERMFSSVKEEGSEQVFRFLESLEAALQDAAWEALGEDN